MVQSSPDSGDKGYLIPLAQLCGYVSRKCTVGTLRGKRGRIPSINIASGDSHRVPQKSVYLSINMNCQATYSQILLQF